MVLIGCISRPPGRKVGFQNATFKNLLVWNYKAQGFHIWYIASSRGTLPKLFKLSPWGQNWPLPGGHNFTLNYIRKTANNFFSWTANGNFTKLMNYIRKTANNFFSWTANGNFTKLNRNSPGWSPTKVVHMVLIGCISRSRGQKIGFHNATFKNLFVWNYKAQSFHIWYKASSRGFDRTQQEWFLGGPLPKLFKWFWFVA